jgi:hypothetical protein
VNMPPMYGEGEKAFIRLQLEIPRTSDDESIFAWEGHEPLRNGITLGLLASSPVRFQNSGDVRRTTFDSAKPPYSMTNKGLRIEPLLIPSGLVPASILGRSGIRALSEHLFLMPLNCGRGGGSRHLAIYLRASALNQFSREPYTELIPFDMQGRQSEDSGFERSLIYIRQFDNPVSQLIGPHVFSITTQSLFEYGIRVSQKHINSRTTGHHWSEDVENTLALTHYPPHRTSAALMLTDGGWNRFILMIHSVDDSSWINLLIPTYAQSFGDLMRTFFAEVPMPNRSERMSKNLSSGMSVSVALNKTGHLMGQTYLVGITIDPDGYLHWPEPPTIEADSEVTSLGHEIEIIIEEID